MPGTLRRRVDQTGSVRYALTWYLHRGVDPRQNDTLAAKRRHPRKSNARGGKPGAGKKPAASGPSSGVRVRQRRGEDAWEIVLPRCARDRAEDLEEVRKMLDAGEPEVARDECLWLLQGCSECLDAHRILGEIALSENDLSLARGHFGYAYRLGTTAIDQSRNVGAVPYRVAANQAFLESGKALAWCLKRLEKLDLATEVVEQLLRFDPEDTLAVSGILSDDSASG